MYSIVIESGQNLCDISLQETGTIDNVFEIAKANNIDCSADLVGGQSILIPDTVKTDNRILKYLKNRNTTVISQPW
ncbi:MAG: hypothetical protein N4A72_06235 [Bacteroidales bacterium]|jgi:hypothetical protein|nr:hypothetical protein [Bacteroidales bacterium]